MRLPNFSKHWRLRDSMLDVLHGAQRCVSIASHRQIMRVRQVRGRRRLRGLTGLAWMTLFSLMLAACQSSNLTRTLPDVHSGSLGKPLAQPLYLQTNWSLATLKNQSRTHTAPDAAATLLETHLRRAGVALQIDDSQAASYRVDGVITRWEYQAGAGDRARLAMTLNVYAVASDELLWSVSGSDTGKRGVSMAAIADGLIADLVEQMPLVDAAPPSIQPAGLIASGGENRSGSFIGGAVAAGQAPLVPAVRLARGALATESAAKQTPGLASSVDLNPMNGKSIAFFYAAELPLEELAQFDHLVLEPDNVSSEELQALNARGVISHAYLSVGEVGPSRDYLKEMDPSWLLGHNPHWDSQVLDLSNPALRSFLVARAGELHARGFGGLFFDTMDSFHLIAETDEQREQQQAGLISLVRSIADRYPQLRLISNRGFEVLEDIAPYIASVAAESLYARWNPSEQRYEAVPDADRLWLLDKLEYAREVLGLGVIAIDYLPAPQRDEARQVAQRIAAHGFVPWVANPELDMIGIGALEVIPRKVLMLYDSDSGPSLEESPVHKLAAMPIEYHGYVPEYLDMAEQALPTGTLKGRYAGIVTWANRRYDHPALAEWIRRQLEDTVPVVMLGVPPVTLDDGLRERLGISLPGPFDINTAQVVKRDEVIDPERSLSVRFDALSHAASSIAASNRVHMGLVDDKGRTADIVVTGDFGGFAWQPGLVDNALDSETYWIIDPFDFLKRALQLPDAPMPDVTSENGKRLWLAHIDGDALPSFAEFPGGKLGAEAIYDEILTRYRLPHTVSVVEGELVEFPAYDDRRERMYDIARRIFRLDNVELASHTYSHPFDWKSLAAHRFPGRYNLAIDGYLYNPERDIAGSMDFIDRELAPPGKRTEVFLWSGNALPQAQDLAVLERLGIPNMNGGFSYASDAQPTLSLVSPMARPVGKYLQVYAPILNENLYTDNWRGPFDGFRRVNETFRLTESPRRLKPINVYYHFYSGTKRAGIKGLKAAYDYSLAQDIFPIYGSHYARKVPDFRRAGVARTLDGQWRLSGLGHVRSIRLLNRRLWPVLSTAKGLAGARRLHDGIYLHTNGSDQVQFTITNSAPQEVRLVSSNGRVEYWINEAQGLRLRIRGEVPVTVELGGAVVQGCVLRTGERVVRGASSAAHASEGTLTFSFSSKDTGHASLHCPT